jgi:hypothetical protein
MLLKSGVVRVNGSRSMTHQPGLCPEYKALGKWSWWLKVNGIRNTHYERVAWSEFRQARHLDYKGLSEKAQYGKGVI